MSARRSREVFHDLIEAAVQKECHALYRVTDVKNASMGASFVQRATQGVASHLSPFPRDQILRLSWVDLAEVGLSHSKQLDDFIGVIANDLGQHPHVSAAIVFPPSTPSEGQGIPAKHNVRKRLTEQAVTMLVDKLHEPVNRFQIVKVQVMLSEDECYSRHRDLSASFFLIFNSEPSPDDPDEFASLFSKSFLTKRRGIPQLLPMHGRKSFKDWGKALVASSEGSVSEVVAHKHYHTGREFIKPILSFLFRDMGCRSDHRCHVRHYTVFSPEMALACLELNAEQVAYIPMLAYTGVTWQEAAKFTAANANDAIQDVLRSMNESGSYKVPGAPPAGSGSGVTGQVARSRPVLDTSLFKHTCPRANGDLPLRECVLSDMRKACAKFETLAKALEDIVVKHNEAFNKSGTTYKDVAEGTAVTGIKRKAQDPACAPDALTVSDKDKEAIGGFAVPHPTGDFELIFTDDGTELYLYALKDGTLDPSTDLGCVQGSFKVGAPAKALMKNGSQWVEWNLSDMNTMVVSQGYRGESTQRTQKVELDPPFPDKPRPFIDFVKWLSDTHHKVRMDLITHKLACSQEGQWSVAIKEVACLQTVTDAEQRKTKKFSLSNIAGLIDVSKFQDVPADSKVKLYLSAHYWEKQNRIMGDFPRLRATGSFSFLSGKMYRLL